MAVTWTLKAADGSNLAHQPSTGSPLALKYDTSGYPHLSGYPTELIDTVDCTASTSSVTINLTPDNSTYTIDQTSSNPTETPRAHSGVLTWSDVGSGEVNLTFTVPTVTGGSWDWSFGGLEPPVALKIKVKTRKEE